ncbi:MAG: ABC transporter permease subunit [Tumebacillaceae bacterium]
MKVFKLIGATLLILIGILLITNVDKGLETTVPETYTLKVVGLYSIEDVLHKVPSVQMTDPKQKLVHVSDDDYNQALGDVRKLRGDLIPIDKSPTFSASRYLHAVTKTVTGYTKGDFGIIGFGKGQRPRPVSDYLGHMIMLTLSYLVPGLLVGIVGGYLGGLVSTLYPKLGRVIDVGHTLIMSLPDFVVVVVLQLLALQVDHFTQYPTILTNQFVNDVPLLIPLLSIALLPAVVVYGTLRIAMEREMEEAYLKTALSKGLSKKRAVLVHLLRNGTEDVLSALPKAVTLSIASMAIAEVMCTIFGLGGYAIDPSIPYVTSLSTTCAILALFALAAKALFWLIREKWVVKAGADR